MCWLMDDIRKAGLSDIEPSTDLNSIYYRQSRVILHSGIRYTVTIEVHQLFFIETITSIFLNPNFSPDKFTFKSGHGLSLKTQTQKDI